MPKLTPRLHPEVRARLEAAEERLSPYAARSRLSRGRQRPEEESATRTAFQRDRDRVVHCKSFRRLKHKTQVFIAPLGDHYRTRLTHTLEVAQVARSLARALRLNEDLTEAIALAHDLGHTPFGHAGEQALDELVPGGFRHHEQSLRVVDLLEKGGEGLNLTQEVRDGILTHSKRRDSIEAGVLPAALTLEGQVVKLSDSIAYINHDLEDALRAGVLRPEDVPSSILEPLGRTTAERIDTLVMDVVDTNWAIAEAGGPPRPPVGISLQLSPAASAAANALRDFLFTHVYRDALALAESEKARHVVEALFEHFCKHPEQLPPEIAANPRGEPAERLVADHIAGMTDRYAIRLFEELYVPRLWTALGGVG